MKSFVLRAGTGAFLFLAAGLAAAENPVLTADKVFTNLLNAQENQASMECVVVREEVPKEGAPRRVSGTLKVRHGGYARLHITAPSEQKAVSDGKFLWVEMADVKQVMKYDARALSASGNFFLNLGSSLRHYAKASLKRLIPVGEGYDEKRTAALELMPTDPEGAGFERMRVWVDTKDWVVREVSLALAGVDNKVRFEQVAVVWKDETRRKKDRKKALPAYLFMYKPPKGYEVFDLISMQ